MNSRALRCALLISLVCPAVAQTPNASNPLDLLKKRLLTISQGVSADWGVYIKSLDTGEEVTINADAVMDTMSAIKVPLLVDVYRQLDAGKINPADRIVMHTSDKRFGTGVLSTLDDGLNLSLHDALMLMIIQSDNTGTDMAFARAGGGRITAPTLITFGAGDQLTSTRFAEEMKTKIPNAELLVFEGCAHAALYEKVDEFNQKTLAFLQRHTGAGAAKLTQSA